MAPLTKLTGKGVSFQWGKIEQQAFDKAKVMISQEIVLAHPNFKKPFIIHTDTCEKQIGGVVSQEGKLIAFSHHL